MKAAENREQKICGCRESERNSGVVFAVFRSAGSGSGGKPERLVPGEPVEEPSTLAGSGQRLQHW